MMKSGSGKPGSLSSCGGRSARRPTPPTRNGCRSVEAERKSGGLVVKAVCINGNLIV